MNVVMIVPTGIEAEIGGHAGDANPVAKLIGHCCDRLITHPNVVNASDINEMPPNTLYVEGSILDRFLEGEIHLKEVKSNRILLVTNPNMTKVQKDEVINCASAGRSTIGADIKVLMLNTPLVMEGWINENGTAGGQVDGHLSLVDQVSNHDFDALAIATPIDVGEEIAIRYYENGGVNPWGKVEAKASRLIAEGINKPTAHAPVESSSPEEKVDLYKMSEIVDPRIAPEFATSNYLHCVLKGLHRAPRIGEDYHLGVEDIDCMITPINVVGRPHKACLKAGIPIIAVEENHTALNDEMPSEFIVVENYLEAAGVVSAMDCGLTLESIRRPLSKTTVLNS